MLREAIGLCVAALALAPAQASEGFSSARAMGHVQALAETIGPRKTGTPGERQAREYIASEMERLGLEVRRLSVTRVGDVVVGSENIVGVLKGRVPDTILIGSHHDSRATSVPGANDDASGVGVMLEAARVLAAAPPVATVMFVSFCAEEEGLLGARQFAATEDLSNLRVMINMDPVGQREIFISPFPAAPPLWANRALAGAVSAGSVPGVIHDPLYLLVTRSLGVPFGADHQPFLDKGIPAFSLSDRFRMWTYHTLEDRPEWIESASLDAAGRSVLELVRWFDEKPSAAMAAAGDPTYVVVPVYARPFFVVTPAILVLAGLTLVLAALWWRSIWWKASRRGRRLTRQDAERALIRAGIPLAGAILGALVSEGLSQGLSGFRFSWSSHQGMHLLQAACWSVAGLGAGLWVAARRPAPDEPEIFMVVGAGLCCIMGFGPLVAGRPDIGFYYLLPAAAILAAAILRPDLAGLGTILGSLPLLTLVTPANYADAVAFLDLSPPAWITGPAMLLLGLPLALGLARSMAVLRWSPPPGSIMVFGALAGVALTVVNATGAPYDRLHRRVIRVLESVDHGKPPETRATLRLQSAEFLRGVTTSLPGLPLLDRRATEHAVPVELPESLGDDAAPTLILEEPAATAEERYVRDLRIVAFPPRAVDRARITLRSTEPLGLFDEGFWIERGRFVRRYVQADDAPSDNFRLSGRAGQTVDVEVRLEMTDDILGVDLVAADTVFQWSAVILWRGSVVL